MFLYEREKKETAFVGSSSKAMKYKEPKEIIN